MFYLLARDLFVYFHNLSTVTRFAYRFKTWSTKIAAVFLDMTTSSVVHTHVRFVRTCCPFRRVEENIFIASNVGACLQDRMVSSQKAVIVKTDSCDMNVCVSFSPILQENIILGRKRRFRGDVDRF